jgi:hypothetical protein
MAFVRQVEFFGYHGLPIASMILVIAALNWGVILLDSSPFQVGSVRKGFANKQLQMPNWRRAMEPVHNSIYFSQFPKPKGGRIRVETTNDYVGQSLVYSESFSHGHKLNFIQFSSEKMTQKKSSCNKSSCGDPALDVVESFSLKSHFHFPEQPSAQVLLAFFAYTAQKCGGSHKLSNPLFRSKFCPHTSLLWLLEH